MNLKQGIHVFTLLFVLFLSIGFTMVTIDSTDDITIVEFPDKKTVLAGTEITINYKLSEQVSAQLFCHTSYGSTIIDGIFKNGETVFKFPEYISKKKGLVDYTLVYNNKKLHTSTLEILTNKNTETHMESYLGPPSIIAGGMDYAMLVVVPTDDYDNPVADSTEVIIRHQFLNLEKEDIYLSDSFIGWKNIFSYEQSGRILVSSEVQNTNSKEYAIEVFPAQAEDFVIRCKRKHEYADGNQISSFITSAIKDQFDNIVVDGTLVEFSITNTSGMLLKTYGTTINGIAEGKMLHPDKKELWNVTAYVVGMGMSKTIDVAYKPILEDYTVVFKDDNRKIIIGPISSFMKQILPDGAILKLKIFKDDTLLETKIKTSSKGYVIFNIEQSFFPNDTYTLIIEGLGVLKEFNDLQL
ncbi:hypothetical protein [uncultured Aquimarina sp.]|uniref:hypothetical protein n=1 Tax=uncultured Aquimarina sp. TaxID=575652 RepID=UPI00260D36BF|nr:hypothetical protein [uncultured Aquimarina sp.]